MGGSGVGRGGGGVHRGGSCGRWYIGPKGEDAAICYHGNTSALSPAPPSHGMTPIEHDLLLT